VLNCNFLLDASSTDCGSRNAETRTNVHDFGGILQNGFLHLDYDSGHIGRGGEEECALGRSRASRSNLRSATRLAPRTTLSQQHTHQVGMTSHSYEISLYGKFQQGDLRPILNRVALHSESAHQMHSREVVFDPPDAALQLEANQEPALLKAKKEHLEPDAKW
jgi:hypothetical protein